MMIWGISNLLSSSRLLLHLLIKDAASAAQLSPSSRTTFQKRFKNIADEPVIFKQARMICYLRFWKPVVMSKSATNHEVSDRLACLCTLLSWRTNPSTHIDRTAMIQLLEGAS